MTGAASAVELVELEAQDGVKIAGLFYPGQAGGPLALLLHMMPATKESWSELAPLLVAAGFSVLAIDLRGHGGSCRDVSGQQLDYKLFEDKDHQAKVLDVEAAAAWLEAKCGQVDGRRLAVVGASIGANLAIAYAATHPEVPAAAALSPGLDYRGLTTPDKVRRFTAKQSLFLAASVEDDLSFQTDRRLAGIKPGATLKEYVGAGHGTAMFEREPGLMDELVSWLTAQTVVPRQPAAPDRGCGHVLKPTS